MIDLKGMKNSAVLGFKKHSPEILIVCGVFGMVGAGVKACVDTHKKLGNVVAKKNRSVIQAKNKFKDEKVQQKAVTKAYAKMGVDLVKVYAPSVTICVLSAASIFGGSDILRKRNMALAAAYATIDASFNQYRSRVRDRFGADVDEELRIGGHREQVEVTVTDEDGNPKKVKKEMIVTNAMPSDYARYFCYGEAKAAEPNNDYNKFFLTAQQKLANRMLRANGFLFLNDVYDMLGIERSIAGQSVGWVYDENSEDHGDNRVDFRIKEIYRRYSGEYDDGQIVYLLDFNVDGNILNHANKKGLITP